MNIAISTHFREFVKDNLNVLNTMSNFEILGDDLRKLNKVSINQYVGQLYMLLQQGNI